LKVLDEELERRKKGWKPPAPKIKSGWLLKVRQGCHLGQYRSRIEVIRILRAANALRVCGDSAGLQRKNTKGFTYEEKRRSDIP
jgi:hypothetical protein